MGKSRSPTTVTSAAHYVAADGVVTVDPDLAAGGSALVALVPAAHVTATTADLALRRSGRLVVRASRPGEHRTTLADGTEVTTAVHVLPAPIELTTWDLVVDDWQPATPGQRSSDTNHVEWSFPASPLRSWRELPGIADAAGIGHYSAVMRLPHAWKHASGAYLSLGTVAGAFRVSVNGVDSGVVDQLSGRVDLGTDVLRPGRFTVTITVATTMINRVRTVQPAFATKAPRDVGLLGPVTLIPYADREVRG